MVSFLISLKSKTVISDMGSRFPRSSSWQAYPFVGAVPLYLTLGTLAFGHGILSRRDSCSDGHSVVVYTTFLLLDFWLCMRKEKQIQKTARGFSPQSVMYLPVG